MCLVQVREEAATVQEFIAAAHLLDSALVNHNYSVCVEDRGQPMGNDDGGPSLPCVFEGGADLLLCEGVECGGGFIEQEEPGALEESTGDGEALAFSAGERQAAFADDGAVVAG